MDVTNKNFLSPVNFLFQLKRAPSVNFFLQYVNLPGLSMPRVDTENPLIRIPQGGDHLQYDELSITFKVDEDLENYLELHTWLRALGKRDFAERRVLSQASKTSGESLKSDISLTLLTSKRNPNFEIVFKDAFPISVSSIQFTTTDTDINYVEASATFAYVTYDITKIT